MIRVAIVEDQADIRVGLTELVGSAEGLECVGAFRTMEEGLAAFQRIPTDVALVDIGLPGMSGIDGIGRIRTRCPSLLCIVLTVFADNERIFNALCAGACGYLLKTTPPTGLVAAIREAVAGGSPMSPDVARRVVELFRTFRPPSTVNHDLTPHELRLLRLLVEGHSYKTAAAALGVSVNTVAFHIRHIYEKLQVHSKSEAVSRALRLGLGE